VSYYALMRTTPCWGTGAHSLPGTAPSLSRPEVTYSGRVAETDLAKVDPHRHRPRGAVAYAHNLASIRKGPLAPVHPITEKGQNREQDAGV
jgi:hypothetical protein